MSGASVLSFELAAGVTYGAIRAAALGVEGAALGAEGIALAVQAMGRQWKDEHAVLRARREAELTRQLAMAAVAARHARIASLRSAVGSRPAAGGPAIPTLPDPIEIEGRETSELIAWCQRTDDIIGRTETVLAGRLASDLLLGRADAGAAARLVSAADVLTDDQEMLGAARLSATEKALLRILARLRPEAVPADRQAVFSAAERVTAAKASGDRAACMDDLRLMVQQVDERVQARLSAGAEAARLLLDLSPVSGRQADRIRSALTEVVDGKGPLTQELRAAAVAELADLDAEADHRYVVDTLVGTMAELGYAVQEGFETLTVHNDGVLRLARGDWEEHAVNVRVDPASGQLRTALVRTVPRAQDEDGEQLDLHREQTWCTAFEEARENLGRVGVHTSVEHLTEPGQRVVPEVARQVSRRRPEARRPERRR